MKNHAASPGSLVVVALMLAASGRADADFISYSYSVFSSTTHTSPGYFPSFDPELGILTDVQFTADGGAGATISFFPGTGPFSGTFSVSGTLQLRNVFVEESLSLGFASDTLPFTSEPTGYTHLSSGFSISESLKPLSFFYNYASPYETSISVNIFSETSVSSPGEWGIIESGADASGTVTYIFTTVPEPASLTLCGVAGLMGLMYGWRRRRRVDVPRSPASSITPADSMRR